MAHNFTLSPEDRLLWQQRAPRASYWFRVSNTHPFIHGGQPIPAPGVTPPPPPYTPVHPPATPTPAYPSLTDGQLVTSFPQMVHPGVVTPFPPVAVAPAPIYNIYQQNGAALVAPEDPQPPPPLVS